MSARALVLTYHGIEPGPPPLFVEPSLLREHLDRLVESGIQTVPLARIVAGLRDGDLPERAVALTFDDGFMSVAEHAVPLLAERGLPATLFCVAGHVGGRNDWPSQPPGVPRRPLADARMLADVAAAGIDLGSHGMEHAPLERAGERLLRRELVDSRAALEDAVGVPVRWFAYPYGASGSALARELLEATYDGASGGPMRAVRAGDDPYALPRAEVHYLRRPALYGRALGGLDWYLALRRAGGGGRRLFRRDWR